MNQIYFEAKGEALLESKAPIKYVVTFTNLKFRLVTPYRSLVIDQ